MRALLALRSIYNCQHNTRHFFMCFVSLLALGSLQIVFAQSEAPLKEITVAASNTILEISLIEDGDNVKLYEDGTCNINDKDKATISDESNPWQSIVNKPYLGRLSGLVILEQVKQQIQQTRVLMDIDPDAKTQLLISSAEQTQKITLYSIDLMHATYPKAQMLTQFMDVIRLMREGKFACSYE